MEKNQTPQEYAKERIEQLEACIQSGEEQLKIILGMRERAEAENSPNGMHRAEQMMIGIRRIQQLDTEEIECLKEFQDDPEALEKLLAK